jgi:hypothetical protein
VRCPEPIVESLEVVDVAHQQRERLITGFGLGHGPFELGIEELSVGERGQRVGQAFGPHHLEILLQLFDFFARGGQPRFEFSIVGFHFLGADDQPFDHRAQRRSVAAAMQVVAGALQLFAGVGEACRVPGGGAGGGVDGGEHLSDFGSHARADAVEPIGRAAGRQISVVRSMSDCSSVPFCASVSLMVSLRPGL